MRRRGLLALAFITALLAGCTPAPVAAPPKTGASPAGRATEVSAPKVYKFTIEFDNDGCPLSATPSVTPASPGPCDRAKKPAECIVVDLTTEPATLEVRIEAGGKHDQQDFEPREAGPGLWREHGTTPSKKNQWRLDLALAKPTGHGDFPHDITIVSPKGCSLDPTIIIHN
jgi:hypothetical protein